MFLNIEIKNDGTIKGFTQRLNRYFLAHKDGSGNFFEIKNNVLYSRKKTKIIDSGKINIKKNFSYKYKNVISESFIRVNSITPTYFMNSKEIWFELEFITPPNYTKRKSIKWEHGTRPSLELLDKIKKSKIKVNNEKVF